jgi:hypothetical protein
MTTKVRWRRRRRLGLRGKEVVAAGCAESRARCGGFIGRPRVPWHAGPGCRTTGELRPDSTRVRARLELEVGEDPNRRAPSISEHEKEKRRGVRADWAGGGVQAAGPVGPLDRNG